MYTRTYELHGAYEWTFCMVYVPRACTPWIDPSGVRPRVVYV